MLHQKQGPLETWYFLRLQCVPKSDNPWKRTKIEIRNKHTVLPRLENDVLETFPNYHFNWFIVSFRNRFRFHIWCNVTLLKYSEKKCQDIPLKVINQIELCLRYKPLGETRITLYAFNQVGMCSASTLGLKNFFPSLCWMITKGTCSSFSPKYYQDKPYSVSNIDIKCSIFWMSHVLIQTWKAPWLDSTSPTRKLTPWCLYSSAASRYFDLKDSAPSAVKLMNNIACQYQQFKFLEHRIKCAHNQNKRK